MRIYQSENGDYIITDDKGIKVRNIIRDIALKMFFDAGGTEDVKKERPNIPQREQHVNNE